MNIYQLTERHDIKGVVTKIKHQIWYVIIIEIVDEKNIEVGLKIKVPYDCFVKLN